MAKKVKKTAGGPTYIRFDWAVKKILRDKANFEVLEGLLTTLLGEEIHIEAILESEKNRQRRDDKANVVDIKASNTKGEIFIIEVQNLYQMDFLQRILFGTASAVTEQLSSGDPYGNIKKVYAISIVYFSMGHGTDYLYHGQTELRGVHDDDVLQMTQKEKEAYGIEGHRGLFPEYYLLRVDDFNKVARTPIEEWMEYLKSNVVADDATAPGFDRLREVLKVDAMSAEEQKAYWRYLNDLRCEKDSLDQAYDKGVEQGRAEGIEQGRSEGIEQGRAEGIEQGRAEGIEQGRSEGIEQGRSEGEKHATLKIAKTLLGTGMQIEQIATITGLTAADIQGLGQ